MLLLLQLMMRLKQSLSRLLCRRRPPLSTADQ